MKRAFIQAQFYKTYYFATCIRNILHDQFAYIRHLNDFYGDGAYLVHPRSACLDVAVKFHG